MPSYSLVHTFVVAALLATPAACSSDTFVGDRAVLKRRDRWVDGGPGAAQQEGITESEESYSYTVEGNRLMTGQPCPPDPASMCAYFESGKVRAGELRMRVWYSEPE